MKKMHKRYVGNNGQAALEFLITYGWAIMAALIVIGALTYFGVTNPATSLPDKCIFSNVFACKDYQISSSALRLKLVNIGGQTIYNATPHRNISATLSDTGAACQNIYQPVPSLDPESEVEFVCNNFTNLPGTPFNPKEKAKIKVTVKYRNTPTGYDQISLGEVYATVQG
ncbi:MAG: hypothetical protein ACP5NW_03135 [Candidatus Woesearchaeota archaeon]